MIDAKAMLSNNENTQLWINDLIHAERLSDTYASVVVDFVKPLASRILDTRRESPRPVVIGINGGQGSGKSTLALFLSNWLHRELNQSVACLALDNFYLGKSERLELAKNTHPLFETRGVPGTHDLDLLTRTLHELTEATDPRDVVVPQFDKAADDRSPQEDWASIRTPVDIILLEGWCVGALPQDSRDLAEPQNELEAQEDASAIWRSFVNEQLRLPYSKLFSMLEMLVMLRVPSFGKVLEWRSLQEQKLRERSEAEGSKSVGQSEENLRRFVMHYERLTQHMLKTMPTIADTVIDIGSDHSFIRMIPANPITGTDTHS